MLVFMPAWNEADTITAVVRAIRQQLPSADLLVVDDGSTDLTMELAREAGAMVAPLPYHQGLGTALQTGYMLARRAGYDLCAHLDADGQHSPTDLVELLRAVATGDADLVVGSRYFVPSAERLLEHEEYTPTLARNIGSRLFRGLLTFTTRHRFTDTTSGFRAANRRAIELFASSYAPDFHELESLQRALKHGLRIRDHPVHMLPRAGGRTKITPLRSAFFVFKGLMVVTIGTFRNTGVTHVASVERGSSR